MMSVEPFPPAGKEFSLFVDNNPSVEIKDRRSNEDETKQSDKGRCEWIEEADDLLDGASLYSLL